MKKITNTLSAFLHKLILNNNGTDKETMAGHLQPVYTQSSTSSIKTAAKSRSTSFIAGAFVLLVICSSLSSCFTSGYGCKGRSHNITRVS
jgi:hypothetical protein